MGSSELSVKQAQIFSDQGKYFEAAQTLAPYRSQSFAIQSRVNNNLYRAQQNHSFLALEIVRAFFGKSTEMPPVLVKLSQIAWTGKKFEPAYRALTSLEQTEILEKVGGENLQRIFSIAKNLEPNSFWEETIHLGVILKQEGQLEAATEVLSLASQNFVPAPLRQRAEAESKAILGQGSFGLRAEFLLSNLLSEATNYQAILPMVGATILGETVANAVLRRMLGWESAWYSRGFGARLLSGSAAFLSETSAFGVASHVLNGSRSSMAEDLQRAAFGLGSLRLFGFLGKQAYLKLFRSGEVNLSGRLGIAAEFHKVALPQLSVFSGLLFAHKIEEGLGLRPHVDDATTAVDTLSAMLTMGIGAHLGRSALDFSIRRQIGQGYGVASNIGERSTTKASSEEEIRPETLGVVRKKQEDPQNLEITEKEKLKININPSTQNDPILQGLLGTIHLMQRDTPEDPEIKEHFAVAADHLSSLGDSRGELIALALRMEELEGLSNPWAPDFKAMKDRYHEIARGIQKEILDKFNLNASLKFSTKNGLELGLSFKKESGTLEQLESLFGSAYFSFLSTLSFNDYQQCSLKENIFQHFRNLRRLEYYLLLNPETIHALVQSSALSNLQSLKFWYEIGDELIGGIADSKTLMNLRSLEFTLSNIGNQEARILASSQTLVNLQVLDLYGNEIGSDGAEAIASSQNLRSLNKLSLSQNRIEIPGMEAIFASPNLAKLEELDLSDNDLVNDGSEPFVISSKLPNLKNLNLSMGYIPANQLGTNFVFASPSFSKLESLSIASLGRRAGGVRAIVASPALSNLKELDIRDNAIGDEGAEILATFPIFSNLEKLNLSDNGIGNRGAKALAASGTLGNLKALYLRNNAIGDKGVLGIAASKTLNKLSELSLAKNKFGEKGIHAVLNSKHLTELKILDSEHRYLWRERMLKEIRERYGYGLIQ